MLRTQGTPQSTIDALPETLAYEFCLDENQVPRLMEVEVGPGCSR